MVLQVKRPNQQYQSTEGKNATKENPEKANNTKYSNTIKRHTYIASPLIYTNTMGVPRGRLSQRAGLPSLNGGEAAAALPRRVIHVCIVK